MSNRVYQHDEYIQNSSELGLPFGKSYQEYLLMSVLFFTFSLKGLTLIMLKFFHKKNNAEVGTYVYDKLLYSVSKIDS